MTDPATPPQPESTAPDGGRPWPAPSSNSGWWRGEGDAAAERPSLTDADTQLIRVDRFRQQPSPQAAPPEPAERGRRRAADTSATDEGTGTSPASTPVRIGRHAAKPERPKPLITYSRPGTSQPGTSQPGASQPAAKAAEPPAPERPQAVPPERLQPAPPARASEGVPRRAADARSVGPHTLEFTAPIRATDPPTEVIPAAVRTERTPAVEPPTAELPAPVRPLRAPAPEPPTAELPAPAAAKAAAKPAAAKPAADKPAAKPAAAAKPDPAPHAAKPDPATAKPDPAPAAAAPAQPESAPETSTPRPQGGFPLWPEGDGPTVPIVRDKPEPAAGNASTTPDAGTAWQAAEIQMMRGGRKTTAKRPVQLPPKRVTKKSRRPAVGLTALVLLALLASFFGWVSADPFWLAVGHAQRGTATVTQCAGSGLQARCVGTFAGASFSRDRVAVSALTRAEQRPGVKVAAQMVSAKGRIAYAGRAASLHLRWILGVVLVVLCGLGIAWATGAGRLETRRARLIAFGMSLGGPILLAVGAIAIAW